MTAAKNLVGDGIALDSMEHPRGLRIRGKRLHSSSIETTEIELPEPEAIPAARPQRRTHKPGDRFGLWTLVRRTGTVHNAPKWLIRCACGTEKERSLSSLINGASQSCGCGPKRKRGRRALKPSRHFADLLMELLPNRGDQQRLADAAQRSASHFSDLYTGRTHAGSEIVDVIAAGLQADAATRLRLHRAAARDAGFEIGEEAGKSADDLAVVLRVFQGNDALRGLTAEAVRVMLERVEAALLRSASPQSLGDGMKRIHTGGPR